MSLTAESREAFRIIGDSGEENFDGDVAVELGVGSAIDLAHAADPQGGEDFEGAEACAGRKRHRYGWAALYRVVRRPKAQVQSA